MSRTVYIGKVLDRKNDMGLYEYRRMAVRSPIDKTTPLPYLAYGSKAKPHYVGGYSEIALNDLTYNGYGLDNPTIRKAYVKAYDKFVEQAKNSLEISMGENLGESRKTLEMIAKRSEQLVELAKGISPEEYYRRQRLARRRKWRYYVKVPGGWWLEIHLAWRPIIQDIYNGCKMLSEPIWELTPVTSRGRETLRINRSHPKDWRFAEDDISDIEAFVSIRGNVRVTNKNAFLLNKVGLVNPALIAWQLAPLSMFVDWVWDVSSFLGQYTDSVGWSLERGQISMKDTCKNHYLVQNPYDSPVNNLRPSSAWRFQRNVGFGSLPTPTFFDRRGDGIKSITRATTAIAVLVGLLGK